MGLGGSEGYSWAPERSKTQASALSFPHLSFKDAGSPIPHLILIIASQVAAGDENGISGEKGSQL